MQFFIIGLIILIAADFLIRHFAKKISDKKTKEEREAILKESVRLDYSKEAASLKRAEVKNPVAKILCVDDEDVILDSFRKILVLDGYSVDTVTRGQEALGLIQTNHYDFVFTDLKMPEMDGVEVCKSVKHLRPDIDVIIITGYASVETAVETMKYGAMDYVQKPFTADELLAFVKKSLIKRQDRIQKQLKPQVNIIHTDEEKKTNKCEFSIPGGVFISEGHCWVSLGQQGDVKIGIDDFAKKLIGKIDSIDFPNLGMDVKYGQPLFTIKQGNKSITFNSPVSGKVISTNKAHQFLVDGLEYTPYDTNWICEIDAEDIDLVLKNLKIGKTAVSLYQHDIERFLVMRKKAQPVKEGEYIADDIFVGELEHFDELNWNKAKTEFFTK